MFFVLSPAKSLDYTTPVPAGTQHTLPQFAKQAAELVAVLKTQSPLQIAHLMDLSDALSATNVARYQAWSAKFNAKNSKQALLAFNGDVYGGLDATTLDANALLWAQQHIGMLSGLYGVLRPLDYMQPYRLEMGTKLATTRGANLYQFWGTRIAHCIDAQVAQDKSPVVVNLASNEYFKSVQLDALKARVVECVFEEYKAGKYKIISFFAKRARGLMARYAIDHRITSVKKLQSFDSEGYGFAPEVSEPDRLVFRRKA